VASPGSKVWGVVYDVPDFLIARDTAAKHKRQSLTNYARHPITVKASTGQLLPAITYRVINPKPGLKTSPEYVGYIVRGLREHGVAEEYIAKVKAIAIANNPTIAAEIQGFIAIRNCGAVVSADLVGMVFANPLFNFFPNTDRYFSAVIGFALRHQSVIVIRADVPFFPQLIERRNEFFLRINRKLESLNGSVMFATASYHSVPCGTQGGGRRDSNRVVRQTQLHIGR
jgi:AIG2-like family